MPTESAVVIFAEFNDKGALIPSLAGDIVRPAEAKRLGLAMLRDLVEKAHHCAGFDPLVAYYPPERRGEAEEAVGKRDVWAEPMGGPTRGARAEGFLRHLLEERTYRRAVALFPPYPHLPRQVIFEAAHGLNARGGFTFGASPEGEVGLVAVREEVPAGLGPALEAPRPADAVEAAARTAGRKAAVLALPSPLATEDALARAVFDLRAATATGALSGDDLPLHTLELFDSLGLVAALKGNGAVELKRSGPPRRQAR